MDVTEERSERVATLTTKLANRRSMSNVKDPIIISVGDTVRTDESGIHKRVSHPPI